MDSKTEQICGMILDYIRAHQGAGDTLEGIAKWWLETQRIESSVDEVADALESLIEQGLIRIRETKSGNIFYVSGDHNSLDQTRN